MPYDVFQSFETIGDPGTVRCATNNEAELEPERQRTELAAWITDLETPTDDEDSGPTTAGDLRSEDGVWAKALELAEGGKTYGPRAARFVALRAVEIHEVQG